MQTQVIIIVYYILLFIIIYIILLLFVIFIYYYLYYMKANSACNFRVYRMIDISIGINYTLNLIFI